MEIVNDLEEITRPVKEMQQQIQPGQNHKPERQSQFAIGRTQKMFRFCTHLPASTRCNLKVIMFTVPFILR